ncbi:MAG: hypothetical protein R3C10_07075 [Pirellulales bacterium]
MAAEARDIVSTEQAVASVQAELSSSRRWWYRLLLSLVSIWVAAILSLWATEPPPLPLRLHASFGCMIVVGAGWIGTLIWILNRRNCPSAFDRIATAWMATAACLLFLVVSVAVACLRGELLAAFSLGLVGMMFLGAAAGLLRRAYSLRSRLQNKLAILSKPSKSGPAAVLFLVVTLLCGQTLAKDDLLAIQSSTLRSTDGKTIKVKEGTLRVPAQHAEADGLTIEIAFLGDPGVNPQQLPTFVLSGGLRDSGIWTVCRAPESLFRNCLSREKTLQLPLLALPCGRSRSDEDYLEVSQRSHGRSMADEPTPVADAPSVDDRRWTVVAWRVRSCTWCAVAASGGCYRVIFLTGVRSTETSAAGESRAYGNGSTTAS